MISGNKNILNILQDAEVRRLLENVISVHILGNAFKFLV